MSSLFAIIHVDFWIPGKYTDSKSNIVLMNVMCDMSGFVVVAPVTKAYFATLADIFFLHCAYEVWVVSSHCYRW